MDTTKITNVEIDDINWNDAPEFCDAFIVLADYDDIVTAITTTMSANAMLENIGVIAPINVAKQLNQLKTGIASDNSPLVPPDIFGKLKAFKYTTAALETYASSTETRAYFGDWSKMVIAIDGKYELRSEHVHADNDQTAFYVLFRADMFLIEPDFFTILTDITLA